MLPSAVILAGGVVIVWSLLVTGMRATLYGFGFEPWTLALAVQICGGAALLFAAGLKSLPLQPIRRWATWAIGGLRVVTTCAFTTALLYASAGQVSLLTTINVLIAMLGVFLVFRRGRRPTEVPGILLMIGGLALLIGHLEGGWSNLAVRYVLLSETSVVLASLLAERHPDNLGDRRQRLALTGFVTLLSALGLLIVWIVAAALLTDAGIGPDIATVKATLGSPWAWIMAFVLGALLRGPGTYGAFLLTARLGADGYMLGMAAMPPLVMLLEQIAASFALVPRPQSALADLGVAAIVIAGGVWVVVAQVRARRQTMSRRG
jgi:drug/metabolite transporter (DMT)-like permease